MSKGIRQVETAKALIKKAGTSLRRGIDTCDKEMEICDERINWVAGEKKLIQDTKAKANSVLSAIEGMEE